MAKSKCERKEVSADDLRSNLAEVMNQAQYRGERFVITRRGKPRAALVSMDDLARLEAA